MSRISREEFDRAAREDARRRARASLDKMTDEEDRAITEAALADPDAQPVDDLFRRKRGRPPLPETKEKVSLRLDRDLVEHFRAKGGGWQTRLNDTLREVVFAVALPKSKRPARPATAKVPAKPAGKVLARPAPQPATAKAPAKSAAKARARPAARAKPKSVA